ncbi:MAG: carboxypeptidase-like regulatory domain-containing protein, partial [Sphingobacterium sp.]
MSKILSFLLLWLVIIPLAHGQQRMLKGSLVDLATNAPLGGATVRLESTNVGTSTDDQGKFTLNVPQGAVKLLVTLVGYEDARRTITAQENDISIKMTSKSSSLETVVVTALGIQRKAKSLTYSTQVVKGDELTKVKDVNPMNNLTGKVSGVQINRSSSGMGGSVNIVLRGFKSNRNNQPLYVIDGLPITNTNGSGNDG